MDKILDFIHSFAARSVGAEPLKWGDIEMMTGWDEWDSTFRDLLLHMDWYSVFLVAGSALLWTAVYVCVVILAHKDHAPAMPWFCLCMNFSWEFQFCFLVPYPEPLTRLGIIPWVFIDAIMFYLDMKYAKMWYANRFKGYDWTYWFMRLGVFALMFMVVLAVNPQWPQMPIGAGFTAFAMNAIMSILFCIHLFSRETVEGTSIWIGICKFLGTFFPALLGVHWHMGRPMLMISACAVVCMVFDLIYIYLCYRRFVSYGLNPFNRKPLKGKEELGEKTLAAIADYRERSANYKLKSRKECELEVNVK